MLTMFHDVCVTIDGGELLPATLTYEQEERRVRSLDAVKPDPRWGVADGSGHFHAFNSKGELPTLQVTHATCVVNDCQGYTEKRYHCRICGEQIEPRWVPDHQARTEGRPIPAGEEWTVETTGPLILGKGGELIPNGTFVVSVVVYEIVPPSPLRVELSRTRGVVNFDAKAVMFGQLRLLEQEMHFESDREPYAHIRLAGMLHHGLQRPLPVKLNG